VPQGWTAELILFNIFINDLDNRTEYLLRRFTGDTKLGRVGGRAVVAQPFGGT